MNHSRVWVFYSKGPHFAETLRRVREAFPKTEVAAFVPPGYPVSEALKPLADEFVETERAQYAPWQLAACWRLVRRIRAERPDVFVVLFDSTQLRLLAALSGAPRPVLSPVKGELGPLVDPVARVLARAVLRRVWGLVVFAVVWLAVRVLPVRKTVSGHE